MKCRGEGGEEGEEGEGGVYIDFRGGEKRSNKPFIELFRIV